MILVFFQSCEKDQYDRISRSDWTKLNKGDTIIYNAELSKDTFVIIGLNDYYYTSDKRYHTEFLAIGYNKINSTIEEKKIYHNYITTRNYHWTQVEWNRFYNGKESDTSLILYNSTINNVRCINNNSSNPSAFTDTKKVFYSNKYGVIQYELYNGQIYIMDSAILKKHIK